MVRKKRLPTMGGSHKKNMLNGGHDYSEGWNTKHWSTERFEVQISNGSVLEWSIMAIAVTMVPTIRKPNHWKSEQNCGHFVLISNWVQTKKQTFFTNFCFNFLAFYFFSFFSLNM